MTDTVLSQILSIRDSGVINMCDWREVQRVAYDQGLYDLVLYIEDDPKRYFHFILYGEEPATGSSASLPQEEIENVNVHETGGDNH